MDREWPYQFVRRRLHPTSLFIGRRHHDDDDGSTTKVLYFFIMHPYSVLSYVQPVYYVSVLQTQDTSKKYVHTT
jgi:hypothetical protein